MPATPPDNSAGWGDIGPAAGLEALAEAHAEGRQRAEAGDLTGARTLLEDALAAGELRLGRDNPRLAPLMVDLATIARNVGNLTEAQNQLRRAYGIVAAAAGPEHATALSIEGRLAAVCHRLGEPTEAYDWHIAEVGPRVLGADHPAVRGAVQRLQNTPPASTPAAAYDESQPEYDESQDESQPELEAVHEGGGWAPAAYHYEAADAGYDLTDASYQTEANAAAQAGYQPSPYEPGVYHRHEIVQPREYRPMAYPVAQLPRRGHTGGIVLVATLGIAIIVAAVVIAIQIFTPGAPVPRPEAQTTTTATTIQPSPALVATPPSTVTLTDNGGSVTLTWIDPSGGRVPFIVSGGRDGAPPDPMETVPAGRTTSTIYGLNENFDYCFTVAAVWSSEQILASPKTCTQRLSTGAPSSLSTANAASVPITASTP